MADKRDSRFDRSRRTLLKGALLSGSLAGCLGDGGEGETPADGSSGGSFTDTPTATPTPTPTGGVPEAERTQGEHPLPDGSAAIDRIVFGNAPSEDDHDLQGETSRVIEGKSDTVARQILKPEGNEDGLGSVSFTVDCDPDERTYLTLQLESREGSPHPIMLFDGDDDMIGYPKRSVWPQAVHRRSSAGEHSEWVYATIRLPEYLTDGQESVELRLVDRWFNADAGPSEPLYRAYTHTDPVFARPADEETATDFDLGTAAGSGGNRPAPTVAEISNRIGGLQSKDRVGKPRLVYALGLAHSRTDWIDGADQDAILETVLASIDHYAIQQVDADSPGALFRGRRSWHEHGALAQGFNGVKAAAEDEGLLSESLEDHPEEGITRREAYTQFFHEALWWRAESRRFVHNQVTHITLGLVRMERALETLDPERYPATVSDWVEETDPGEMVPPADPDDPVVERWIDEDLGLAAMTDEWLGWDTLDDNWFTVSEAGIPIEHTGFAMSYSGSSMQSLVQLVYEDGSDRVQERFLEMLQAHAQMRWWVNDDGDRNSAIDGTFTTRKPGHVVRNGGHGYGRFPLVNFLAAPSDVTQTWAELFLEQRPEDDVSPWELQQKILYVDGYRQLQQREGESDHVVPMDRDHVWTDEELGYVVINDGDTEIKTDLGYIGWTVPAVSGSPRVHYHGPRGDRIIQMDLDRIEFRSTGSTWTRPDSLLAPIDQRDNDRSRYAPWRGETITVNQAMAGEELQQAAKPNGEPFKNPYRKHLNVSYREVQIEEYLIGMNSTGAQQRMFGEGVAFQMAVPDGSVVDVETGETVSGQTVTVEPQSTRVLRIE